MKIVRVLNVILIVAMMASLIACAGISKGEDFDENDVAFTPDMENLIGIAVYPVSDVNSYPYESGEKVTDFSGWKYIYAVRNPYDPMQSGQYYDDTIVCRDVDFNFDDDMYTVSGTYVSSQDVYLGYVYGADLFDILKGNAYIIATRDLVNLEDNSATSTIVTDKYTYKLTTIKVPTDQIPDSYKLQYVYSDEGNDVECKYTELDLVAVGDFYSLLIEKTPEWDSIRVAYYVNGSETVVNGISCVADYDEVFEGQVYWWSVTGYQNGESCNYPVLVSWE